MTTKPDPWSQLLRAMVPEGHLRVVQSWPGMPPLSAESVPGGERTGRVRPQPTLGETAPPPGSLSFSLPCSHCPFSLWREEAIITFLLSLYFCLVPKWICRKHSHVYINKWVTGRPLSTSKEPGSQCMVNPSQWTMSVY